MKVDFRIVQKYNIPSLVVFNLEFI